MSVKHVLTLICIASLWVFAACVPSGNNSGTCVPGSTFDAGDGCNTCECPSSGFITGASCTEMVCGDLCANVSCPSTPPGCDGNTAIPGVLGGTCNPETGECESNERIAGGATDCEELGQVCVDGECVDGENLCENVTCPGLPPICDGNTSIPGIPEGVCNPETGECETNGTPAGGPTDCEELGQICVEGECVETGNLCEGVECPGTESYCEGDTAYTGTPAVDCNPETGTCDYPPVAPPQDCAADGLTCVEGQCVKGEDLCADVTCPGTEAFCDGNLAHMAGPEGVCNPETGACEYPPGGAPIDCSETGQTCKGGQCGGTQATPCGGIAGLECPPLMKCDKKSCGADIMGECVATVAFCPEIYEPVCGCDGETYSNNCKRIKAGAAFDYAGECEEVVEGLIDAKQCANKLPKSDPFSIKQSSIADDVLTLTVQYGGGCKEHFFTACFDNIDTVFGANKVDLTVIHDANDDNCLALPIKIVNIDLGDLKSAYMKKTGNKKGTIQIKINDENEPIKYSF